jgi:hypothetical protein
MSFLWRMVVLLIATRAPARGLGLLSALGGAIGCATLFTGTARALEGDGFLIQLYYETRQIDCARRWRDHLRHAEISMVGCIGFDQATPYAAEAALAGDQRRAVAIAASRDPLGRAQ